MALRTQREIYTNATIDTSDMTITEYNGDSFDCYSLTELFQRWNGIEGVTLRIETSAPILSLKGGALDES